MLKYKIIIILYSMFRWAVNRSPNLTVTLLSPLQSALGMAVIYGGDSVRPLSLTNNVEAVQEKEMG